MWQGNTASSAAQPSAKALVANLKQDHIKAKKSLGQNFVTDDGVLLDIVEAAGVRPGDLVLEVGPGTGNLTKHLLASGAHVVAIEKDDKLYERLVEQYKQESRLQLVHGDVLQVNLRAVIQDMLQPQQQAEGAPQHDERQVLISGDGGMSTSMELAAERAQAAPGSCSSADAGGGSSSSSSSSGAHGSDVLYVQRESNGDGDSSIHPAGHGTDSVMSAAAARECSGSSSAHNGVPQSKRNATHIKVVANLPYNITKDFLSLMLPMGDLISELSIMIQEEAAQRLTDCTPSRPDYRAMNLVVQFYSEPKYRFLVPKEKYFPVPGVDGALVTFELLPASQRPKVPSERDFLALVSRAFEGRRKMLRNNLQPLYSPQQVEAALAICGLRLDARAQDLSFQQFTALHRELHELKARVGSRKPDNK